MGSNVVGPGNFKWQAIALQKDPATILDHETRRSSSHDSPPGTHGRGSSRKARKE